MKYARIVDGTPVDICTNPKLCFHPLLAQQFVEIPDEVDKNWHQTPEGIWRPREIPEPENEPEKPVEVTPSYQKITREQFTQAFTPEERVAVKNLRELDAVVDDYYENLPKQEIDSNLPSTQRMVKRVVDEFINQDLVEEDERENRINEILWGVPK